MDDISKKAIKKADDDLLKLLLGFFGNKKQPTHRTIIKQHHTPKTIPIKHRITKPCIILSRRDNYWILVLIGMLSLMLWLSNILYKQQKEENKELRAQLEKTINANKRQHKPAGFDLYEILKPNQKL